MITTGSGPVPVIARIQNGSVVLLEGNPALRSGVDAKTQGRVYSQFSPDRVTTPTKNGDGSSWDTFDSEITAIFNARKNVRILRRSNGSLTKKRLYEPLLAKYADLKVHVWSAAGRENSRIGLARAYGRQLWSQARFDRADIVVTFGSDFLGGGPGSVRYAADFALRRQSAESNRPFRLYSVESTATLTGRVADHRMGIKPSEMFEAMRIFAGHLSDLGVSGLDLLKASSDEVAAFGATRAEWLRVAAKDFAIARGKSVAWVGGSVAPEVHAVAAAINDSLGNVGKTVEYTGVIDPREPRYCDDIADLTSEMETGEVDCLIILDGNPAYDAPADVPFAEAMKKVTLIVHFTEQFNETSKKATWVLPHSTPFHEWGLHFERDRLLLQQPVTLTTDPRGSTIQFLRALGREAPIDDEQFVRETFASVNAGGAPTDDEWVQVKRDGYLAYSPATVSPQIKLDLLRNAIDSYRRTAPPSGELEVTFIPCTTVHDGSLANNPAMQELADPISQLRYGNAAWISTETMGRLGLAEGELVRIDAGGRSTKLPVISVDGQPDGVVTLTMGGGRTSGSVSAGVGYTVFPLRTKTALDYVAVTITGLNQIVPLARAPRELRTPTGFDALLASKEVSDATRILRSLKKRLPLFALTTAKAKSGWAMVLDQNLCTGCGACVIACHTENNVELVGPDRAVREEVVEWVKVRAFALAGQTDKTSIASTCVHCGICETACPEGAIEEPVGSGVVLINYQKCTIQKKCSDVCPVDAISYGPPSSASTVAASGRPLNGNVTLRTRGEAEKCTYCVQRLGVLEPKTACQTTCPSQAITFGDATDENTAVFKLIKSPRAYDPLASLGKPEVKSQTVYLSRFRNPNPDMPNLD